MFKKLKPGLALRTTSMLEWIGPNYSPVARLIKRYTRNV